MPATSRASAHTSPASHRSLVEARWRAACGAFGVWSPTMLDEMRVGAHNELCDDEAMVGRFRVSARFREERQRLFGATRPGILF